MGRRSWVRTFLGGVLLAQLLVPVDGAAHAERDRIALEGVAVARRGDRVEADAVRLARLLRVLAGRDHAVRLALPVRHLAAVVDDDVARLARRRRADDPLHRHDLARVRRLVLEGVDRHARLVVVRLRLEEVLLLLAEEAERQRVEQAHLGRRHAARDVRDLPNATDAKKMRAGGEMGARGGHGGAYAARAHRCIEGQRGRQREQHPWVPDDLRCKIALGREVAHLARAHSVA